MSRTRRVFYGAGIGYVYQAAVVVVGLWLTPVLLAALGQHDYGLWLIALQLLAYLALLDLGIVALLPREVAAVTGRTLTNAEASKAAAAYVGETIRLVLMQWPVVAVVGLTVWLAVPDGWEPLRGPGAVLLFVYVATFPGRILPGLLQGLQDLSFLGVANIAAWVVGTAVTVWLVLGTDLGLYAVSAGWAVTQFLAVGASAWRIAKRHSDVWPRVLPSVAAIPLLVRLPPALWVSLSQLAQVLVRASDIFVLARIAGPGAVVAYSITKKLLDVIGNQPQMIMQAALPGLAQVRGSGDRDHLRRVTATLRQMMLLMGGLVATVVVMVNEPFVAWWISPDQFGGATLTSGLVVVMLLRQLSTTSVYTLFCFGRDRRVSLITICDGVLTVVASIVLTPQIGAVGVVVGALIGVCLVSLPATIAAELQVTNDSLAAFMATLFPVVWRIVVGIGVVSAIRWLWLPVGLLPLVAATLLAVIIYALLILPLLNRPPIAPYVPRWFWPSAWRSGRSKTNVDGAVGSEQPAPLVSTRPPGNV